MKSYIGIDWGGTLLRVGIVSSTGKLLKKETVRTAELSKPPMFLAKIKELVTSYRSYSPQGVGIGAPGIVNIPRGFIYYLPNVPGWRNYPLRDALRKAINLPVVVDNDANVFALAEARQGAAKNYQRALFLTLGTGLGGAFILNGKILRSTTSAGEFGHVPIHYHGKPCGCGGTGCIETYLGNRYLIARYKKIRNIKNEVDVEEIYKKALHKEKPALLIWREFSLYLGKFLAGMVNIFNPQAIILGGGVSGAIKVFKPMVMEVLKQQAMWPNLKNLKVFRAQMKDSGVIGAGLLAQEGHLEVL
ncbi:MAG: ROK family protein [Candidatus Omnitrophica bacterium]|nr:ROK family protein [Candidatus Omnitrophota bacterium]